ncbi:MAG: prephenate dehydrogenase [Chloroflexota bacterium]
MSTQISILGLGQIGKSFGLALADHKGNMQRVGYDRSLEVANQAKSLGAVDKVTFNLHDAVKGSQIVLLCLPLDEIRATLGEIIPDLQSGTLVMDTAPVKNTLLSWAQELLPAGVSYISLLPVPGIAQAESPLTARADLFQNMPVFIVPAAGSSQNAVRFATDIISLLGATPLFIDAAELDGLTARTQTLPQLIATALVLASAGQPGWFEATKTTGLSYAAATMPLELIQAGTLQSEATLNRTNTLRVLDDFIAAIEALRTTLFENTDDTNALSPVFENAMQARELWWIRRSTSDWETNPPPMPHPEKTNLLTRWFGLGRFFKKK